MRKLSRPLEPLEVVQQLLQGGYIKWMRSILPQPSQMLVFKPCDHEPDQCVGRLTEGVLLKLFQFGIVTMSPNGAFRDGDFNVIIVSLITPGSASCEEVTGNE